MNEIRKTLEELAQQGDELIDQEKYEEALEVYSRALNQVPDEEEFYGTRFWFLAAIGDVLWYTGSFDEALPVWDQAIIYGGIGNAFVHLRRGQVLYELGHLDEAETELHRAMLLHGPEIFDEEDIKYSNLVSQKQKPPAGHKTWKSWKGVEKGSKEFEEIINAESYRPLLEKYEQN